MLGSLAVGFVDLAEVGKRCCTPDVPVNKCGWDTDGMGKRVVAGMTVSIPAEMASRQASNDVQLLRSAID